MTRVKTTLFEPELLKSSFCTSLENYKMTGSDPPESYRKGSERTNLFGPDACGGTTITEKTNLVTNTKWNRRGWVGIWVGAAMTRPVSSRPSPATPTTNPPYYFQWGCNIILLTHWSNDKKRKTEPIDLIPRVVRHVPIGSSVGRLENGWQLIELNKD